MLPMVGFLWAVCLISLGNASVNEDLSDDAISEINRMGTTWEAGRNFDEESDLSYLAGEDEDSSEDIDLDQVIPMGRASLPKNFDSRKQWPKCKTISEIRDQAGCASCWAVSSTGAMSDRLCIHSKGKISVYLSGDDMMTCCTKCGKGCNRGHTKKAWQYWVDEGVVSGGHHNCKKCCKPYSLPPCLHGVKGDRPKCKSTTKTPECKRKCQSSHHTTYEKDLYFGKSAYMVTGGEEAIMQEIYQNGPVIASMQLFSDLIHYKKGVYQHKSNKQYGTHAVRIIGWGVEKGVPYWLVANTWNSDWGDKGFFKILRGSNECNIEKKITAGLPKV